MFINAWELLLKARILEDTKRETSLFYPKERDKERRTLSLRDGLKRVFPNERDPVRINVGRIADIRDKCTHFLIEEMESIYSGLFQAGVLNYMAKLDEWFALSIADKCSPAMLSLVFDVKAVDPIKIRRKYGIDTLKYVVQESQELSRSVEEINDDRFSVRVEYQLVLRKSAQDAEIVLSSGADGRVGGLLIEVGKALEKTHPHRQQNMVSRIRERLPDGRTFNTHDFQCILHKERIKGRSEYHYKLNNPVIHRYSDKLIDFIVGKIVANPDYLVSARESYRRRKK